MPNTPSAHSAFLSPYMPSLASFVTDDEQGSPRRIFGQKLGVLVLLFPTMAVQQGSIVMVKAY